MKELTKAEEQVMQILWDLNEAFVKEIVDKFPNPKPAYNTVSTIVRILQRKGFIDYNAYGKTHKYFPKISKPDYTKAFFNSFLDRYFSNSFQQLVSFFAKEEELSINDIEELKRLIDKQSENQKTDENG